MGAAVALCSACGVSSSDHAHPPKDAGASMRADVDLPDAPKSCNAYGAPGCPLGRTCCLSGEVFGTCLDLAACTTTTQYECTKTSKCGPDEVCCGTFIDAPNGLPTTTTFCRKSCTAPAHPTCFSSQDCPQGGICTSLPEGGHSPIAAAAAEAFLICLPPDGGS